MILPYLYLTCAFTLLALLTLDVNNTHTNITLTCIHCVTIPNRTQYSNYFPKMNELIFEEMHEFYLL